ncbi:MAG: hypothetical protein ACFFCL_14530, partial [Promethearchaeota archaeon]
MKINKFPTIHPLIFSCCPIIFLYIHNLRNAYIEIPYVIFYCFVSVVFAEFIYLVAKLTVKDELKAGVITSSFLIFIFFFPYGYFFNQPIIKITSLFAYLSSVTFFSLIYIVIFKTKKNLMLLTRFLNTASVFLILIIILNGILFSSEKEVHFKSQKVGIRQFERSPYPDIYYIILDAYARQDILQSVYGYDNSEFITYLRQNGFFVADKSRANYNLTLASLSSSLNFQYLDEIADRMGADSSDKRPLIEMIKRSKIRKYLTSIGYNFISFSSGIYDTEIRDSDFYINPLNFLNKNKEFESILFKSNLVGYILNRYIATLEYDIHRRRIIATLNQIPFVTNHQSPAFVFAHIVAPHPPFVFSDTIMLSDYIFADGSALHHNSKKLKRLYAKAYCDQISALNKRLIECINNIINNTQGKSIIIIQSDHGPRLLTNWADPFLTDLNESTG